MKTKQTILTSLTLTLLGSANFVFAQVPFAGNGTSGYSGDGGLAINAQLSYISAFCGDAAGNIYISDFTNADVRKVDNTGIITTVAGNQIQGYSGDGGLATAASFSVNGGYASPLNMDITKDGAGNLYINDINSFRIRKVTSSGIISTVAGTGTSGNTGDGALATSANINASNIAVDNAGNIYFSDIDHNVVRKISTAGIITTIAGNGTAGFSGDGGLGTLAKLNVPKNLTVDAIGNIYVADAANYRIRKITPAGIITTYAGNGIASYSGDGGLANLASIAPTAMAISPLTGNLIFVSNSQPPIYSGTTYPSFVIDTKCNLRSVDVSTGIITTVRDSTGFLMGSSTQYVAQIRSFYIDNSLNMYFSPDYNICVGYCIPGQCYKTSLLNATSGIEALDINNKLVSVYPNPSNGSFNIVSQLTQTASLEIYDITGKIVHTQTLLQDKNEINVNLASGNYNAKITANGVSVNKKIVITK